MRKLFIYSTVSISVLEDIDPSIGRFRNMVKTTVIPSKVRLCYMCTHITIVIYIGIIHIFKEWLMRHEVLIKIKIY